MITLITDEIEIDLYECLKRDPFRHSGQVRAYIPPPYHQVVYLPLSWSLQRLGRRIWFLCAYCSRRTSKLYVSGRAIACRNCLDLKYASQYRKDVISRRDMTDLKLERLDKQRRRLWYAGKPTQFGRQFFKLREEDKKIREEIRADLQAKVARLDLLKL